MLTDTGHLPEAETFAAQEAKLNLLTVIADKHLKLDLYSIIRSVGPDQATPCHC